MFDKIKKSLGIKIVLVFSAVVVVLGFFLNLYFLNDLRQAIQTQVVQYFSIIIDGKKDALYAILDNVKTRTADWSSDGYIRNTTEAILNSSDANVRNQLVQTLGGYLKDKKMPLDPSVAITDIVDKNGSIIASSDSGRIGGAENDKPDKLPEKFGEASAGFGTIAGTETAATPLVYAVSRIFSAKETLTPLDASLFLHFSKDREITDLLNNKTTNSYQTIKTYLVNSQKFIIALSRTYQQTVLSQKMDNALVRACLENKPDIGQQEYKDYLGKSVLGFSRCLKDYNLVLVTEIQNSEIFSYLNQAEKRMWLMLIFIEIFGVLLIFAFSKFLLRNLNKVLSFARKISSGDLSVRVKSDAQDEIGELAQTVNTAVDALADSQQQVRQAKKLLQESNKILANSLEERTKENEEIKDRLEWEVDLRTQSLQDRVNDLEKFKTMAVGRELKMVELKKRIEELEKMIFKKESV